MEKDLDSCFVPGIQGKATKYTMSDQLSSEQTEEFNEAFTLISKDGGKTIQRHQLGFALRSIGQNMTDAEICDIIDMLRIENTGIINITQFLSIAAHILKDNNFEDELKEAFRAFDKEGNGLIPVVSLRHIMTNLGDKLPEDEVDEMLREANINAEGKIDYEELIRAMVSM